MKERQEIAEWLYNRILEEGYLSQSTAVQEIAEKFGDKYIYNNENGNPAIDTKVLAEFRKLKGDKIVWEREDFSWRTVTDLDRENEKMVNELLPVAELPEVELPEIDLPEFEQFDLPIEPIAFEVEPISFDQPKDLPKDEDKKQ